MHRYCFLDCSLEKAEKEIREGKEFLEKIIQVKTQQQPYHLFILFAKKVESALEPSKKNINALIGKSEISKGLIMYESSGIADYFFGYKYLTTLEDATYLLPLPLAK